MPLVHQFSGRIEYLSEGFGISNTTGPAPGSSNTTTSVTGDTTVTTIDGESYAYHFLHILDPADAATGHDCGMNDGAAWTTPHIATPGGDATVLYEGSFTANSVTAGVHTVMATAAGASHVPKAAAMEWWIDGPGYPLNPPVDPGPVVVVEDPDGVELADLTDEVFDVTIRIALNDPGWGSFKINRHSALATAAVLTPGNYVRVTIPQIDPEPIFGFFLEGSAAPETPTITLVSTDEEGGEVATFGGRGSLSYWDRAIWLAESFLVDWWPAYMEAEHGTPPAGTLGMVRYAPGSYNRYTVSGSTITSTIPFTTVLGFSSYYDSRRRFTKTVGTDTYETTLVHLTTGGVAGWYVKPYGAGVTEIKASAHYRFGNSVLMESIDDGDKPGQVIYAMYGESQAADRPIHPLPGLTVDFDATNDSDGNPWTTTDALKAVSVDLGDDYLSTIGKLTNTGAIDVYMDPDLGMHAYNSYSRDLTATIRFAKGLNIADELERDYSDQPTGTFVEVQGQSEGVIARVIVAGSPPREISVHGDSDDTTVLEALGEAELALRELHSDSVGFGVDTPIVGHEDVTGLFLPGPPGSANGDYWIGDLVTLHTGTDTHDFDEDTVRIAAITLTFTDSNDLRSTIEVLSGFGGVPTLGSPASSGPTSSGIGAAATVSDLYQLVSERDQPFGYPSLDDDALIAPAEIPVVEDLRTNETDTSLVLSPDGSGGLTFVTAGAAGPFFFPEDYGAVGDGVTNDYTAIRDCIDAAIANGGGVILFGPKTYAFDTLIEIDGTGPHIHLWGTGNEYGPTVLLMTSTNVTAIAWSSSWADASRTFQGSVRDLVVRGPRTTTSGVRGIYAKSNVNLDNVGIDGFYDGLVWDDVTFYSRARGCFFTNQGHASVYMQDTNNCTIDTCRMTGDPISAASLGPIDYGVLIACTSPRGINNRIVNSSIEYFVKDGLALNGGYACEIVGNYFETQQSSSGFAHVRLGSSATVYSTRIESNYFQGDGTVGFDAIAFDHVNGVVIGDNKFGINGAINISSTANTSNVLLWNNHNSPAGTFTLPASSYTLDPANPPATVGTPALSFGTANSAGTATSAVRTDATLAIFDATAPVTQAFSDVAATGSAAFAARRDHRHGMPATPASTGQILISDTPSTPLIFADLIQNEAQDDLVYAD